MGLSKKDEKELARLLYMHQTTNVEELAARTNVSQKTIRKWIKEDGWDKQIQSMVTLKDNQLYNLYDQLTNHNKRVAENGNTPNTADIDITVKLTAAIRALETKSNLSEILWVAKNFTEFVRDFDLEQAQKIANYFDLYIQDKSNVK